MLHQFTAQYGQSVLMIAWVWVFIIFWLFDYDEKNRLKYLFLTFFITIVFYLPFFIFWGYSSFFHRV
jgi:hypothetical protein